MSDISVIVPFKNSESTLHQCVDHLLAQDYPHYEVILVDNESSDSSLQIAKNLENTNRGLIKVYEETMQGVSAARNKGAKLSSGQYLAFIDSDCLASPSWLKQMIACCKGASTGAVAGKTPGKESDSIIETFHGLYTLRGRDAESTHQCFDLISGGFPAANLMVKRSVFEQIGGFDETIPICGEDYDLCARIYKAGYHILYTPKAIVFHKHRDSLKSTWKQGFCFGKGHARLLKRHFKNYVHINLGKLSFRTERLPVRIWIDLSSADKKVIAILVLAGIHPLFWVLVPIYAIYLMAAIRAKGHLSSVSIGVVDSLMMSGLLLLKSLAMTSGRIYESILQRVVCL